MQNIVYMHTAPRCIDMIETEIAPPELGYTQIQFLFCGICGTDFSKYNGTRKKYPISLGHEFVAQVNLSNGSDTRFAQGSLVVSDFNFRCGCCELCVQGKDHLCLQNGCELFSNRGFAKYANVKTEYLFPTEISEYLPRACLTEPLSCCIHACSMAEVKPNDNILINGCGSIGSLLCFYLKKCLGFSNVFAYDTMQTRCDTLANIFGIISYTKFPDVNFDIIFDCSGSVSGLANALKIIPLGGGVCIMSHIYGEDSSFVYEAICKKELNVCFPLRNGNKENMTIAGIYLANNWISEFDSMIAVYNDVITAFNKKSHCSRNKQVVDLRFL